MRIARILTRLNLGGPARQVLASDPELLKRGHELRLFCGVPQHGEGDLFEAARERGLDVQRVPGLSRGIRPLGDWKAQRFLTKQLRQFAPDIVHTHASKAGWLGRRAAQLIQAGSAQPGSAQPGFARPGFARPGSPKLVHTFHGHVLEGYFPAAVSRRLVNTERRLAAQTDRIVAVSHATAADLLRLQVIKEEQLMVIPPGVDLGAFLDLPTVRERQANPVLGALRQQLSAKPETVLAGMVGRLAQVKQPHLAIDVLKLLAVRYPQLELVFVGDGDLRRSLEGAIQALDPGLAKRVHLLGAREDMPQIWSELDLALCTSRSEGMPVALIEAAASARPAVSFAVGGIDELVAHERTGFLGDTTDELAYGLSGYLDKPSELSAAGGRARIRVERRHSARALADNLESLYLALHESRATQSSGQHTNPERPDAGREHPQSEDQP